MSLLLVGMSHRTASLELRERFALEDPRPVLSKLVASPEIDEAVLLSTCNRVEVMVWTREVDAARLRLRSCFERELASGTAVRAATSLQHSTSGWTARARHVARARPSIR